MAASLAQFGQRHVGRGVSRIVNAVITSGKGCNVQLADGRKMLDFTCGIGVTSLGMPVPCLQDEYTHGVPRSLSSESKSRSCRTMQQSHTCSGKYSPS